MFIKVKIRLKGVSPRLDIFDDFGFNQNGQHFDT